MFVEQRKLGIGGSMHYSNPVGMALGVEVNA